MNSYQELWRQLTPLYDETEAKAVVRTVLEVGYGLSLADILCGKVNELSAESRLGLQKIMARLAAAEPVQYVLGQADFCGRTFRVAPGVLIPRPETQELCRWIVAENVQDGPGRPAVLDVGTGSGCIAVTLALDLTPSRTQAWDVSAAALDLAAANAKALGAQVEMVGQDALKAPEDPMEWDIIVSNPPYIRPSEARLMADNVLKYEPHTALFIPEERPLLFYEAIARYAQSALKPGGKLYFEINPLHAGELEEMLKTIGFIDVFMKTDSYGKVRMARGVRPNHPLGRPIL